MKIYIAASYPRKAEAKTLALILAGHGHTIVSTWTEMDEGYNNDGIRERESTYQYHKRLQAAAIRDVKQVKECDVIISFTDGENQLTRGGRHSEFGIAVGLNKKLICIGPKEHVLHYLPNINEFADLDSFLHTGVDLLKICDGEDYAPKCEDQGDLLG
jgi:hypothetical protein